MSLTKYTAKRNFSSSPEPAAEVKKNTKELSFVVQRHKASHLHYDFRLEMEGVLKSWAVPKGPSLNPADKRLAMMVEDHPYDYKDFKGIIPEGYGAGIVEIWDKGTYTTLENESGPLAEKKLLAGLKAGNLKFTLHGKKLKGEFALVKLKGKEENSWLLLKHRDKYAVDEYDSEKETAANSPINKWLAENKQPEKKKAYTVKAQGRRKLDHFTAPMLAKETDEPFNDKDWLFEIKWDGYRAIAEINKEVVELYRRNGISFNRDYPVVYNELKKLKHDMVLDGEIVVINEEGKSDFQKLQHYEDNTQFPVCYYVFDLLFLDGHKTTGLSLLQRKELLKKALKKNAVIKYSDHVLAKGIDFYNAAKQSDLEGIMAKKADSEYFTGTRTSNWLKIKHHKSEEAVVVGYTEPTGSRSYFGALVLAVQDAAGLKYAGHTGSGFTDKLLKEVYQKLQPLVTKKSPFKEIVKTNMPVTWVKPAYVCEVKFTEWTNDGKMRHPIFLRMREDKNIKDIVMIKAPSTKKSKPVAEDATPENDAELVIGKANIKLTNQNKIYFPEDNITKGMVVEYYQQMSEYILPYLKDRPESLKRNPNGIHDSGFFHKDAGEDAPAFVKRLKIFSESANKDIDYIICNDRATLAYLNNLGCIELNPWNSTIKNLDKPDYLIIDIDPSEKNNFEQVIETANAFKTILDRAGATAFCKTSGATGLHIYLPMGKKYLYEQVKDFAHFLCTMVNEILPDFTTLERNLAKRGDKHIYLDYLQNRRGQTIAAPYSLRPKIGATVSAPLDWKEVKKGLHPRDFTIHNILARVTKAGDIFSGVLQKGVDIKKCLDKLS